MVPRLGLTTARLADFDRVLRSPRGENRVRRAVHHRVCAWSARSSPARSGLRWPTFLFYNATGAVVWCTAVAAAGYALAYSWDTLERWIGRTGLVALVLVIIVARHRAPARHHQVTNSPTHQMNMLASGLSYVDLNFLGVPRIIATVVLHGPGGVALIDPGPSSTLPALRAALEQAGIRDGRSSARCC